MISFYATIMRVEYDYVNGKVTAWECCNICRARWIKVLEVSVGVRQWRSVLQQCKRQAKSERHLDELLFQKFNLTTVKSGL